MNTGPGRPATVSLELILTAILFRLREGCRWRALNIFAPYTTIYYWWRKWVDEGVLDKILATLQGGDPVGEQSIDSTYIKVHKHGSNPAQGQQSEAIGKSRGGLTTKIHARTNAQGKPTKLFLSPGNEADISHAPELVIDCHGCEIIADKAYDGDALRCLIEMLDSTCCIPSKSNRIEPIAHDSEVYKHRHFIENFFQRLKELRAVATRYEKLASTYLGLVTLSAIMVWIS